LPELKEPTYVHTSNYMRAGIPIVLMPDKTYFERFPPGDEKYFIHHLFAPYYFLVSLYYK